MDQEHDESGGALRRIQHDWDSLGRTDPLWAILTDETRRRGKWDLEEFFATGREEIGRALEYLNALGAAPQPGRALDFGCGVGRLTQALAGRFAAVDGVDVAPSMVERARALNQFSERCQYHLNEHADLRLFPDRRFDFIYSSITLQHIEPPLIRRYLAELARTLKPGGVLLFQLPSEKRRRSPLCEGIKRLLPRALLRLAGVLRHGARGRMQMNGIKRQEVERLLREAGCRVVDVQPDGSAGESWISYRYCAVKDVEDEQAGRLDS